MPDLSPLMTPLIWYRTMNRNTRIDTMTRKEHGERSIAAVGASNVSHNHLDFLREPSSLFLSADHLRVHTRIPAHKWDQLREAVNMFRIKEL